LVPLVCGDLQDHKDSQVVLAPLVLLVFLVMLDSLVCLAVLVQVVCLELSDKLDQ